MGARPGTRLLQQTSRAGGNPLFVCELVGALLADGAIVTRYGEADLASVDAAPSLPPTILRRLSFASPDVFDLLGLASVIGSSFAAADLALLARAASVRARCRSSGRRSWRGVLAEKGDRLAFRHELIRDALYDDMPLTVRRGLHAELARGLADAGEPIERTAEHVVRGAAPGDERASSRSSVPRVSS